MTAEWMTGEEAAALLGVSRQRVYQIAHQSVATAWPIRSQRLETRGDRPAWRYHRGDCEDRKRGLKTGT